MGSDTRRRHRLPALGSGRSLVPCRDRRRHRGSARGRRPARRGLCRQPRRDGLHRNARPGRHDARPHPRRGRTRRGDRRDPRSACQHLRADGRFRGRDHRLSDEPSCGHARARRGGRAHGAGDARRDATPRDPGTPAPHAAERHPADRLRPVRRAHRLRATPQARTRGRDPQRVDLRRVRIRRHAEERARGRGHRARGRSAGPRAGAGDRRASVVRTGTLREAPRLDRGRGGACAVERSASGARHLLRCRRQPGRGRRRQYHMAASRARRGGGAGRSLRLVLRPRPRACRAGGRRRRFHRRGVQRHRGNGIREAVRDPGCRPRRARRIRRRPSWNLRGTNARPRADGGARDRGRGRHYGGGDQRAAPDRGPGLLRDPRPRHRRRAHRVRQVPRTLPRRIRPSGSRRSRYTRSTPPGLPLRCSIASSGRGCRGRCIRWTRTPSGRRRRHAA